MIKKILIFNFMLICFNVFASNQFENQFETKSEKNVSVFEENLFYLRVSEYKINWLVPENSSEDYNNPEKLFIKFINTMKNLQFKENLNLWDADSKLMIEKNNKKMQISEQNWLNDWSVKYKNKSFLVKEKIKLGSNYILIPYYKIENNDKSKLIYMETISMKKVNDRWFLTMDLINTPVPGNWMKPGFKSQKIDNRSLN